MIIKEFPDGSTITGTDAIVCVGVCLLASTLSATITVKLNDWMDARRYNKMHKKTPKK